MKRNLLFALIAACTFGAACNKKDSGTVLPLPEDTRCINRVQLNVSDYLIAPEDIPTVNDLFKANKIDYSSFRYTSYAHDSESMATPPYTRYDIKTVGVQQYANGLPIFNDYMSFSFKNDVLNSSAGTATKGTSLDTKPVLKLAQVRKLFIDDMLKNHFDSSFADSCIYAEFGYYNTTYSTDKETLIKAWQVSARTPNDLLLYPVAYYQDADGKLIYFNTGIFTNELIKIK